MNEYEFKKELSNLNEKVDRLIQLNMFLNSNFELINELSINLNTELSDTKSFCPICNSLVEFKSFGRPPRKNALCPICESLERHRLLDLVLKQYYYQKFNRNNIKLLHFAPEPPFYNMYNQKENIDYYPVDFSPEIYEPLGMKIRQKVNMEDIPYQDNEFDIIHTCHVLEHVPNDIQAMNELYRVLDSDGICFIMVPRANIPKTIEKEEYNTPELRLKYYGQIDHLRKYGFDFKDRLESVGFNVKEFKSEEIYKTQMKRDFYRLFPSDSVFVCTK